MLRHGIWAPLFILVGCSADERAMTDAGFRPEGGEGSPPGSGGDVGTGGRRPSLDDSGTGAASPEPHTARDAGSEVPDVSVPTHTESFRASTGFSGTQGANGWYYRHSTARLTRT